MTDEKTTGTELGAITRQIDAEWTTRRRADGNLSKLLYEAWKIFEGRRGAPKKDADGRVANTFSGYLRERGIPRSTAKDLIRKYRVSIGEIEPVPEPDESGNDEELDGFGQFSEAMKDAQEDSAIAQNGTVAASVASGDAIASPPARVPYKPLTPAELKTKRAKLEKQLVEAVGKEKAQQIIDKCVVDHLTVTLNVKISKKTVSKESKALIERLKGGESWQEAA